MANVLITGASKGIGFELTKIFLENGHRVVAVSRNTTPLLALNHPQLITIGFDLSNGNYSELLTSVENFIPHLDILLNNAGALVNKPFLSITPEDLQQVFAVNVFSVVRLTQILLPHLQKSLKAHVINISSMGGFQGAAKFGGLSAYSSSKAAVACLGECLAEEFKETNVVFNTLCLGAVQTEMLSEAFPGYQAPIKPIQMALYIYQFSTEAHHYISGKTLPISLSTP